VVAVEADWPDAYRVNRYVRDRGDLTVEESLRGFERFPTWMWRNTVVLDFVVWLREHNDHLSGEEAAQVGFYGLDVHSLYRSMEEVINYLEAIDPQAAARARERYSCFDQYAGDDAQSYGYAAAFAAGTAYQHAQDVIAQHLAVLDERDAWSEHQPSAQQENNFLKEHGYREYAKWHLGEDDDEGEETKGRYKFPYGDFERVHQRAVLSAESRAGQYKYVDIENAAPHTYTGCSRRSASVVVIRNRPRNSLGKAGIKPMRLDLVGRNR
jgi:erythromycin esterase-like protein